MPPGTQPSSHFVTFLPQPNFSPNLLPTPGNSDSRSSSDFPISWGENKKAQHRSGSTPLGSGCVTCHQNTGMEPNKYFYIQQIRCQAGIDGPGRSVRS